MRPVAKEVILQTLNDQRPIALTSILMKGFEHAIQVWLLKLVNLDFNKFEYSPKRSPTDARVILDYITRKHSDKQNHYVRVLFVDFSSARNFS